MEPLNTAQVLHAWHDRAQFCPDVSFGARATAAGAQFCHPDRVLPIESMLCQHVRQVAPNFPFTSIFVSDNKLLPVHADLGNAAGSRVCAMPLTAFSHGQIWVHQPGGSATMDVDGRPTPGTLLPVAHGPVYFDPFVLHGSSGDRLILLAFSPDMCPELLRRGFCPARASRPASLELCAGSAGLSASLREAGFDAIAVDLATCERRPKHSRIALDLTCTQHQQAVLHFVETSPSMVYIHAGLPCGTCSRAREPSFR